MGPDTDYLSLELELCYILNQLVYTLVVTTWDVTARDQKFFLGMTPESEFLMNSLI